MKYKDKKVGVLLGGMSSEREVSFNTGGAVVSALKNKGYDVVEIDPQQDLAFALAKESVEVVYIALHGKYGEDGCTQGLLEIMQIPYTGSGVISSAVAIDKHISNTLAITEGLTVPESVTITQDQYDSDSEPEPALSLPVVVKPMTEGSSVGISIVQKPEEWKPALEEGFKYDRRLLVQRYIKGREITVGVVDGRALGTVEIKPKHEFYNYTAKYTKGGSEYLFPAPLSEQMERDVFLMAEKANLVFGCEGATRVDFILGEDDVFYFLEVNTLPGLTATSLVPMVAKSAGIPFDDLVEQILSGASLKMGR